MIMFILFVFIMVMLAIIFFDCKLDKRSFVTVIVYITCHGKSRIQIFLRDLEGGGGCFSYQNPPILIASTGGMNVHVVITSFGPLENDSIPHMSYFSVIRSIFV